ncbi:hypothetical protein T11_18434 [Trichinella zimbabwensis]|uniref:Uncharacterized protein n=1 Tax=Trichinella zimbabwensis TaxID=268475 RepID=A0A0V1HDG6_9BILA|nr:hypothetical protein T11_18434 [Trichinella zimbabwensis]
MTEIERNAAVPADLSQIGNLNMEELWTAESTWEWLAHEEAFRHEHRALQRRRLVAESRVCSATQQLNPCLRKTGERILAAVNETCSDPT